MFHENLKYADSPAFLEHLTRLINKIWDGDEEPESWKESDINAIFKNSGSKLDAKNFRGINVGAILSKLIPSIIMKRISYSYESILSASQYGFRKNRPTTDAIFTLLNILQKSQNPIIGTFIDLKAAYDWIPRDALLKIIELRTGASKLTKVIKNTLQGTKARIKGDK